MRKTQNQNAPQTHGIAKEISSRIKYELGVTVSIGVSWNKIFAKLGSDYKKQMCIRDRYVSEWG